MLTGGIKISKIQKARIEDMQRSWRAPWMEEVTVDRESKALEGVECYNQEVSELLANADSGLTKWTL